MKILVTGATGFIGSRLCEALREQGHTVVALSRDPAGAERKVAALEKAFPWDSGKEKPPLEAFEGVDGIVNLAGETVMGRWTPEKRRKIHDSRVVSTRLLAQALHESPVRPKVVVSASAIGYYGDRGDEELTEDSPPGNDFLPSVSIAWEREASSIASLDVRVAIVRIGVVLARGGGALDAMLTPFKMGAGGPIGSGKQWWSWVHREDVVGLALHALQNEAVSGPVNATAPNPLRQKEFAKVLGKVLHRPAILPTPAFAIKMVLGGFASELLSSKRVLPKKAGETGYSFQYPDLEGALRRELS